jgi:hypothetical protein
MVSITPRPTALPRGKYYRYPLERRLGGPQSWNVRGGNEKKYQPLSGIEPWSVASIITWILLWGDGKGKK